MDQFCERHKLSKLTTEGRNKNIPDNPVSIKEIKLVVKSSLTPPKKLHDKMVSLFILLNI